MSYEIQFIILLGAFILLGCSLIVLVVYFVSRTRRQLIEKFEKIASYTGLDFKRTGCFIFPSVEGTFRGRYTKIFCYFLQGRPVVNIRLTLVMHNTLKMTITIHRTGDFAKIFGWGVASTGDTLFDDAFIIKTNDKNAVSTILSDAIRSKLIAIKPQLDAGFFGISPHKNKAITGRTFPNKFKRWEKYLGPEMTIKIRAEHIAFRQY